MGTITTFYSYKGGVGRTMALANMGVLLAERGLKVLLVDFDLEAPGLDRYFAHALTRRSGPSLLSWLEGDMPPEALTGEPLVSRGLPSLQLVRAGGDEPDYESRLLRFDWLEFFEERDGGQRLEDLRDHWKNEFAHTLVDSRTGITDIGGVCTVLLPDILMPVFTANSQAIDGTVGTLKGVQRARSHFPRDRLAATVLPVLSRFDARAEFDDAQKWLDRASQAFSFAYDEWLPAGISRRKFLERTKVPYVAKFSFGEALPVLASSRSDPEGAAYAYETLAALLTRDFDQAEAVLEARDSYIMGTRLPPPRKREVSNPHMLARTYWLLLKEFTAHRKRASTFVLGGLFALVALLSPWSPYRTLIHQLTGEADPVAASESALAPLHRTIFETIEALSRLPARNSAARDISFGAVQIRLFDEAGASTVEVEAEGVAYGGRGTESFGLASNVPYPSDTRIEFEDLSRGGAPISSSIRQLPSGSQAYLYEVEYPAFIGRFHWRRTVRHPYSQYFNPDAFVLDLSHFANAETVTVGLFSDSVLANALLLEPAGFNPESGLYAWTEVARLHEGSAAVEAPDSGERRAGVVYELRGDEVGRFVVIMYFKGPAVSRSTFLGK